MTATREYKYEGDVLYLKCSICGEWGTLDTHPKNKNKKFGVVAWCRKCNKQKRAKFYWNHRDEQLEASKEYLRKNRKKMSDRARERCRKNKEVINARARERRKNHKHASQEKAKAHNKNMSEIVGFSRKYFHNKATEYVNENGLKPSKCSICGQKGRVYMHHPSYESFDKRSEVVFCCPACHSKIHIGEIECPTPVDLIKLVK